MGAMTHNSIHRLGTLCLAALAFSACRGDAASTAPNLAVVPDSSPADPGAAEPNLSASADGRVLLSWLVRGADSATALRFAVRSADGAWGQPREVMSRQDLFVNWADFPSVITLADGRLLAHWLQRNGTERYAYEVRLAESRDGGTTWGESVTPHTPGIAAEHGFVEMIPTADSGAMVVFLNGGAAVEERHGRQMHLGFATWTKDGGVGASSVLDHRVCDCCQTGVAMTSRGPIAVYRDRSDEEIRDMSVVRLVDGAWTEPTTVHRDGWRIDGCPVNGPAISARGDVVAVAWFAAPNDSARVQLAFSGDAGATFGAPVRIDGGQPTGRVDVELIDDRRALVSWIERTVTGAAVHARLVSRDGTAGAPLVVGSSDAARSSGFPRMARLANGVLMAWTMPGTPSAVRTAVVRVGR